jgi:4,5-DOPA dioxygenase extradiol
VKRPAEVLVHGYAFSSVSMTAYTLDADCPRVTDDARPAGDLPDPALVSPEDSNA